jgi:hypothetical protein
VTKVVDSVPDLSSSEYVYWPGSSVPRDRIKALSESSKPR